MRHKRLVHYEEYKASKAQARITRAANLRAEADLKAQAKQRMEAASEQLVGKETWGGPDHTTYAMLLTYRAEPFYASIYRHPTPEALDAIRDAEAQLEAARRRLEGEKRNAWESGSPVTEAEIQAARAAGEVTDAVQ